jgi:hypothetical protein
MAFENYEKLEKNLSLPQLLALPDRFINGIMSYRLGYVYGDKVLKCVDLSEQYYKNAHSLVCPVLCMRRYLTNSFCKEKMNR